jgi:hypothetical protein
MRSYSEPLHYFQLSYRKYSSSFCFRKENKIHMSKSNNIMKNYPATDLCIIHTVKKPNTSGIHMNMCTDYKILMKHSEIANILKRKKELNYKAYVNI